MFTTRGSEAARPKTPPSVIAGLADGRRLFIGSFAKGLRPPRRVSVAEWAEEKRWVSADGGSPFPGQWSNDRAPYLIEFMECCDFADPCREVSAMKSTQSAFTEGALNFIGKVIDIEPAPLLYVLPTLEEADKFNKLKLQPTIDVSPALKAKVRENKSRDSEGSTAAIKRYRGGFLVLAGANSSKALQMISVKGIVFDEMAEYPPDAGGRGDPVTQGEERNTAYDEIGYKRIYISVPGIEGACRITKKFKASDQRRLYVPCPHCGAWQVLQWKHLKWTKVAEGETRHVYYVCQAKGCTIEHHSKRDMVTRAVWLKTYPMPKPAEGAPALVDDKPPDVIPAEAFGKYAQPDAKGRLRCIRPKRGRNPGFHFWQAYSPFKAWSSIVADFLAKKDNPRELKSFTQQQLGEAWEERGQAPEWELLYERSRHEKYARGLIPATAPLLTGACDVQADGIYFEIVAWGAGMRSWVVDMGFLPGNTADENDVVWSSLTKLYERRYRAAGGGEFTVSAFGIDAGFNSNQVYNWCSGRSTAFALKGEDGWYRPALGSPSPQDITIRGKKKRRGVQLWPVGTWSLKGLLYAYLRKEGPKPGAEEFPPGWCHFGDFIDERYFQQLTAEHLVEVDDKKTGEVTKVWKARGPNHLHDCRVYNLALAEHLRLPLLTDADWAALCLERGAPVEARDLIALSMSAKPTVTLGETSPATPPPPAPPEPATPAAAPEVPAANAVRDILNRLA